MKLIDKDALVAEIQKLDALHHLSKNLSGELFIEGLFRFLDTSEVKEVDIEKEAELIANGIMIGVQANKYKTAVYNTKRNDFNHSHLILAARKGIELGLKVTQQGE